MSQYISLERAATVLNLSTGDVNRLRERGTLQGFRDGGTWKFKEVDIANYLTQQIKETSRASVGDASSPEDDDLFTLDEATGSDDVFALDDAFSPKKANPNGNGRVDLASKSGLSLLDEPAKKDSRDSDLNLASGSGLSLLSDDDDLQLDFSGNEGLSLLDDPGGSDHADDVVLGAAPVVTTKSPAKPAIDKDDGLLLVEDAPVSPRISLSKDDDDLGLSLVEEDDFAVPLAKKEVSSKVSLEKEDDSGIFELLDDDVVPVVEVAPVKPVPVKQKPIPAKQTDGDVFDLSADMAPSDESDSDSDSQVISLFGQDDDLHLTPEQGPGGFDPFAGGDTLAFEPRPNLDKSPNLEKSPFGPQGDVDGIPADDFNDGGFQTPGGFDLSKKMPVEEPCSYNKNKVCAREAKYSGIDIALLLVPSIIFLIPASMAAYELIRSIWAWDQPSFLPGTILEFCGKLIKLIN